MNIDRGVSSLREYAPDESNQGVYAPPPSPKYPPDEIQNSMLLLLMNKAFIRGIGADAKTCFS